MSAEERAVTIASLRATQAVLSAAIAQIEAQIVSLKADGAEETEMADPLLCPSCGAQGAPCGTDELGRPEAVCRCGRQFLIEVAA